MYLNPNEEVKLHIGSEHPVIQVTNGLVYISRSPGAQEDGIRLADGNQPLDLRGWGNYIYVYNDSPFQADVRLQGGKMAGVSEGVQDNNGGGGDQGGGGGGSNWDPSDSTYSAQTNSQAGSSAYSLVIGLQAYDPMSGDPAPYDGTVTYTLSNWATSSGPNVTNPELSYQTTDLDGMTTDTLYFDSAGMWQGSATLSSSDPNHGSTTVFLQGEVYSSAIYSYGFTIDGTTVVTNNLGSGNASSWQQAQTIAYNGPAPSDAAFVLEGAYSYDTVSGENYVGHTYGAGNEIVLTSSSLTASTGAAVVDLDIADGVVASGKTLELVGYWLANDGSWRTQYSSVTINGDNYTVPQVDVADWANQQVTNLSGNQWVQAENLNHPIPSDGSFVITSALYNGVERVSEISTFENRILTTNQWASIKISGASLLYNQTLELTGYWVADDGSWQDAPVTWTMVRP